jgi:hypothetical protein
MASVFLDHPWREPDLGSLVLVAPDGVVRGFIGLLPLRMTLHGRRLRGAVASSVMVEATGGDALAGARLMRAFLDGPQDFSFGEAAADVPRRMWLRLGAQPLPLRSLRWMRVLRPAGFAADVAARRVALMHPARLLAVPLDALLSPRAAAAPMAGADVTPAALAEVIPDALRGFALRPDFDLPALCWLLGEAARKERRGALVARVVTGRRGRPVGGWLGHLRPHGLLQVKQVFAPAAEGDLLVDDIFQVARQRGAVAVAGPNQPELMAVLQLRGCFFRHAGFALAHARDPALAEALQRPDAFLGGVAGETWIRLSGSDLV